MADSNSLVLLPPRHTARAPQDSSSARTSKRSKDDSFGKKLEKAQAQKSTATATAAITPVKKPAADEVANSKVAATPEVAPADDAATDPSKTTKAVKKSAEPTDEDPVVEAAAQDHQPATPTTQVVATGEEQVHKAVEKKPVKIQKAAAGKATAPGVVSGIIDAKHPVAAAITDAADADAGDDAGDNVSAAKAAVTSIGDDQSGTDADSGQAGDSDSVGDGEFGTGKIVTAGGVGGKNPAAPKSAAASNSAVNPSAAAAVAIATVDPDADSTAETSTTQSAIVRLDSHPVASSNDLAGLTSALPGNSSNSVAGKTVSSTAATPQARFVEENHPKIVTAIQGQLMPHGGTVQIRLDPPELGALQVTMHLKDGVMTASFETSNDDATKLLSHSLGQLKTSLEAAGVTVDKIHVEQAPKRDSSNDSESDSRQSTQEKQGQAQQDQQRREAVQRMWRKLSGGGDPLDLVA